MALLFLTLACRESVAPEAVTATATHPSPAPPAAPAVPEIEGPRLVPVDEASGNPEFAAYRQQLLEAVHRRDADAVIALVDPHVRTDFGGGGGADDFRKSLAAPGTWENLDTVLTHGGTFLGSDAFWAPYVYSAWPEDRDAFQHLAILGEKVPVRDAAGKVFGTLTHSIVERTDKEGEVRLVDGRTGSVDPKQLWSPVGYRAGFNKVSGAWRMTAFVAGD